MEKELLDQIVHEAGEYKINSHNKRKTICDNNIVTNCESEKFHAEADKSYWKAIAELIPKEVLVIEMRGSQKEQDKKPFVVMIQGPKPGKPTDLSRMRQIIAKLNHITPIHLKHSPQPHPVKADASPSAEAIAVT